MTPKQKQYLNLIKTEPVKFGHWTGFEDLIDIHNEWIKSFLFVNEDQTLLAHRGSYKTTCLAIAIAFLIVLFPNKNIIFFRKTDSDVIEIVLQVKKLLLSDYFQKLVLVLYETEIQLHKESSFEIDTNLKTSSRGTSQLLGSGIKASITGKHADIIITDDIVNVKDRVSKAEREFIKLQYQELQNIKNRGGRFINTGTPWHKEDAISSMPNVTRYDCFKTGLIDKSQMQHLRDSMSPSLFAANYELKHIADQDAMFTNPKYTSDTELIYNGVAHIDAGYGGGDGTAFTIIKAHGDRLIGFGKRWDKHVDDCLNSIVAYHKEFRAGTIHVEKNADKGYLAKELNKRKAFAQEYHESQNKFIKITTYLRKYWSSIEWLEDTDPDYINEILDYTENAEHDDSPDSAASLLRKIKGQSDWLV
ncbi:terminase family protein [Virgibacillus sp. M23]|uniref:terminase large subunit domain-containing protein n=1 Tax=Virgibacillus sp. M23 TaxID=3079030 RepID=UPI002A914B5E|nr:terminase family protein [Virgibacillus sp. M23]MDY7044419.1 terminase family protein [Virgibacillus sp. M23]